ncbi:hypothetical protein RKD27_006742 [Streptomyces sp. SAI-126]
MQEFEDLVEGRRVGGVRRTDREDALDGLAVVAEQVGDQLRFAGRHPVAVALDGVDLTVVRDEAVRVGERPRREGVRGEPGVHERDRGGEAAVGQVREEGLELTGGQHALVDDGARGQRGEVDVDLALGALAQHERLAVERDVRRGHGGSVADEDLAEGRHRRAGGGTEQLGGDRDLAPAEDGEALLGGDRLDLRDGVLGAVLRQEGDTDGVRTGRGQFEAGDLAEEGVRNLGQDARAVTRVGLGAGGTAVLQVAQNRERLLDQRMARLAGEGGHEADATGVLFVAGVVHTLRSRASIHERPLLATRGVLGRLARRTHRLSRRRQLAYSACRGTTLALCVSAKFRAGYMMERISGTGYSVPTCGRHAVRGGCRTRGLKYVGTETDRSVRSVSVDPGAVKASSPTPRVRRKRHCPRRLRLMPSG